MRPEARPLTDAIEAMADGMPDADAIPRLPELRARAIERLTEATDGPLAALRRAGPDAWIAAYEGLSSTRPVARDGRLRLEADRQTRKRRGSWYTPPAVVEAALDAALDPLLDTLDAAGLRALRICDPAAGPGRFLVAAARRIAERLDRLGVQDPRRHAVANLWAADLDPGALALARAVLADFAGQPPPAEHFLRGDAIAGPVSPTRRAAPPDAIHWHRHAPDGFDVVLGNPPYRAGRLAKLDTARLRAVCPTAEYQLDPFALFLDRAARLARRRMALLVPTTWMSNHRARRLRGWLLTRHRLDAVVEVPDDAFDAAVETAVAVFTIDAGPTAADVPVRDLGGARVATVHPDPARPQAPLPLSRSPRAAALLRAARAWTTTLGDVTEINRGINPYHHTTHSPEAIAERVHHSDHQVTPDWSPELRGRDIADAYRLDWKGDHWIHYGPWLKEPRAPRFFTGPRLLVRKILARTLCGVFVEHDAYCDQSVYIARVRPDCPYPPYALLACVNSDLIATLVRTRHQTHRTHFPQLKVGELRALPLPPAPPTDPRWRPLAERAEAMQRDPTPALADAIEAAVAALYGLGRT